MARTMPNRYLVAAMMSLLYFLLMAGTFNSLGVVLPMMVNDLHLSWAQAGFGFTLLGIACGSGSLLPAIMIRKVGVSLTLSTGAILLVAGFGCLARAQGPLAYDIGTILLGVGFCFAGTVPGVHVISGLFTHPARPLGIYFATGGLGSVSGPILFYLSDNLLVGWRPFWIMGASAAFLIGCSAAFVTRARSSEKTDQVPAVSDRPATGWSMKAAIATPQAWIIIAGYSVSLLVNTTMHSFAVQHLSEHGISLGRAAAMLSAAALVGALTSSATGLLGDKFGAQAVAVLSMVCLAAASFALTFTPTALELGVFIVTLGMGIGSSYVCSAILLLEYFGRRPNLELYSLMCMISTLAAFGPTVGGLIRDQTGAFHLVFLLLTALEVATLMAVLLMRRPSTRAAEATDAFATQA